MNTVYVVVLAGGRGRRFWPLTFNKPLVPFFGKPLVVHNLELLKLAGFTQIILVIHPEDVQAYMDLAIPGLTIQTVIQQEARGMGDALLRVEEHIGQSSMLVMNAEDVVEPSLYEQLANAIKDETSFITGKRVSEYFDGGYLSLEGERVVRIVEKPGREKKPSDLTNLVFHYFRKPKNFFELLAKVRSDRDDVYELGLDELLKKEQFRYLTYEGVWAPLKYPWHVLDVMDKLFKSIKPYQGKNVEIKSHVTIDGPVYIDDNVRIFENTKIVGPVYIGRDTIIGNNNIIRQSHIGARSVTGFNTDITRSYVGDDCWFHSNYIGDSVLETNVGMGSGAVLANLRLDEGEIWSMIKGDRVNTQRTKFGAVIGRDVRIGVNASIMPGVKIGKGSFVGAGVMLDKDLLDNKFCMGKTEYIVMDNTRNIGKNTRDEFRQKLP